MKPRLCNPHLLGVRPNMPPFFSAGCPACQKKKARGVVTGNEPSPEALRIKESKRWKFGC